MKVSQSATCALVSAALLVPLAALPATAAEVNTIREVVDETFEEELCGIPVTTRVRIRQTIRETFEGDTFLGAKVTGSFRATSTAENGRSVTISSAGVSTFTDTVNDDGTITFTATYKGLAEKIKGSRGPLLADRGVITIITTVDIGDPEDFEDDVVVEEEVIQKGPHPEADSGFSLFCSTVEQALA